MTCLRDESPFRNGDDTMIYITGDIHGNPTRFSSFSFPEQKEMTKNDYVIICGDFGLVWDYKEESPQEKYLLDWLNEKTFTTLFLDGNHECFARLNSYPVEEWHGGKVHKIRDSVIHLMRGQVFKIDNKKIFTFGGASSHDIRDGILEPDDRRIKIWKKDYSKLFRINGRSWWKEELPSEDEMKEGLKNLEANNNKVDYIITHCTSSSLAAIIGHGLYEPDVLTDFFQKINETVSYKKWFFGHYHIDRQINPENICLFEQIIRIS